MLKLSVSFLGGGPGGDAETGGRGGSGGFRGEISGSPGE